jgi:tetratricopeptide (TPR) repeat protein
MSMIAGWTRNGWRALVTVFLMVSVTVGFGQGVPRAQVVEDEAPANGSIPRAVPVGPNGQVPRANVVDEAPKPKGPDEDLFSYGTLLYERGEYGLAIKSYSNYVETYPGRRHAGTALFRIGECLIKQGQEDQAARYYEEVVRSHAKSEGAPSAAYRLGAIRFNVRDFEGSVNYFGFCERTTKVPQVALAAAYNMSRGYQMMGQTRKQLEALQRVIQVKTDNPYRDAALMTLAKSELAADKLESALALFQDLMDTAADGSLKAEATVNVAVLMGELKRPEEAVALFDKALLMKDTTVENRALALVGVVQSLYDKGDYNGVIEQYTRNASVLPNGTTRGKMLLLVGNAYRMKKTYSRAVELYLMVEQEYPDEDVAFEAGYWKLYCFYLLEDKDLGEFANAFLKRWAKTKESHEFVAKAALMRADHFFNTGAYEEAAGAFLDVPMEGLSPALRSNALFNMGYSQVEAKRFQEAIGTLTRFLNDNSNHEFTENALAHRGLAYREVKDFAKAKEDFRKVVKEFPKSGPAELAWYQLGLIATTERNPTEKIQAFENLVKLYPQSQAVPQAWFGIGTAAYENEDWPKAQEALRRAIRLDAKAYLESASQMLLLTYYAQEDDDGLAAAIDEFVAKLPSAVVPPNVLGWLGLTKFSKDQFKEAARYLTMAATLDAPENTQAAIWNYLGMAQVETGEFKGAEVSMKNFLAVTPQPGSERGKGLLYQSRALLGQAKYEEAVASADEALGFIKTGRLHADLLILEGDILFAKAAMLEKSGKTNLAIEEYRAAAAKYIVPSQFFVDPVITPMAVWKTILALEKSGEVDRARQLRKELQEKYPAFRP